MPCFYKEVSKATCAAAGRRERGDSWIAFIEPAAQSASHLLGTPFIAAGDRLYFKGFQPQTGTELWVLEEK